MDLPKEWHDLVPMDVYNACMNKVAIIQTNPDRSMIFRAFTFFPPMDTRYIILGQDPFPAGADGLAFSSRDPRPSSMKIIDCLIRHNIIERPIVPCGSLNLWAQRGVLLINTMLTQGKPLHTWWYPFTKIIVQWLIDHTDAIIFSWGNIAAQFCDKLVVAPHRIQYAAHPVSNGPWDFGGFDALPRIWTLEPHLKIYTDGACSANGKTGATAAYATVFQNYYVATIHGRVRPHIYTFDDVTMKLGNTDTPCAPSNNRGELLAILMALLTIYKYYKTAHVEIVTDSEYSMKQIVRPGTPAEANHDLLTIIRHLSVGFNVRYIHQAAHIKDPRTENERGNAQANDLAVVAKALTSFQPVIRRRYGRLD